MNFPTFVLMVVLLGQAFGAYWNNQARSSSMQLTQILLENVNENQRRVALLCGEKYAAR
jgi:hypothetical protein